MSAGHKEKQMSIDPYLEDLERRLDPEVEEPLLASWKEFCDGRFTGELFSPRRSRQAPPGIAWPAVAINRTLEDLDAMMLQQIAAASGTLAQGGGGMLAVRANYGTGILPSVFGAPIYVMDEKLATLPTSTPYAGGGADAMRRLLACGEPDLDAGYGARVFAAGEAFRKRMQAYPKVSRYVSIYHPDLQGPMDVTELLWGSSIFIDLLDDPGLGHAVLERVTETYVRFMRRWFAVAPQPGPYARHWGMLHRGAIMLRNDSAMNFSPEMFDTFFSPYDQQLLQALGGGAVHFCGRGSHYIGSLAAYDGLTAVQLSQPQYNDMETVFRNTVDKGIALLDLSRKAAEEALRAGRSLHGRVHSW